MHKSAILIAAAAVAGTATAQTTEFGNGEHLCYLANDVISRCWTNTNVPATAAPVKECMCSWKDDFDQDLIGCWEYIQTAVSFISPVTTPPIEPYAGYCGPVTPPSSQPTSSSSSSSSTSSEEPEPTTYDPPSYSSSTIIPEPTTYSASNPITTVPHYNSTTFSYTVSMPSGTVVPEPSSYTPAPTQPTPPPVATGGARAAAVGSLAGVAIAVVGAVAFGL